jgi:hypothetical protein
MTFAISEFSSAASSRAEYEPSIKLATLNVSAHGRISHDKQSGTSFKWENSALRTVCN